MNRQNQMTGILLLLAAATSQAAVVREWNFVTGMLVGAARRD